ncbi:uncharacterized protein LOC111754000 [Cavia porcellus]|uniref:uncharacterized protein LOC111754000 n=1 Tax=Cavia porcellus TaxID=10141 RepID=UPI002FE3E111
MASWHLLQWVVGALWPPLYPGTAVPLAKGRSERRPQVPAPYPGSSLWLRKRITTWAREQPEPRERAPPGLGSSPAPLAIPAAAAAAATAAAAAKPSRRPHIPRRPRPPRRTAARTAYNTRPRHATRLPALGSLCGLPPEVRLSPGTELVSDVESGASHTIPNCSAIELLPRPEHHFGKRGCNPHGSIEEKRRFIDHHTAA